MNRPHSRGTDEASMPDPRIQIALDCISMQDALVLAEAALHAGADQLEVGKPFIEFLGLDGAASLVARFPGVRFELDLMIMAGSARNLDAAARLGAHGVTVTALAPLATIEDAVARGRDVGVRVCVDLFNTPDPVAMARQAEDMGAGAVMVHVGVDQRRNDPRYSQLDELRAIADSAAIPVAYATYDADEALDAVAAGAAEIVQGSPLIEADDPRAALGAFISRVRAGGAARAS